MEEQQPAIQERMYPMVELELASVNNRMPEVQLEETNKKFSCTILASPKAILVMCHGSITNSQKAHVRFKWRQLLRHHSAFHL